MLNKKKLMKVFATMLASFSLLSAFAGCNGKNDGENSAVKEEQGKARGMHERTVSETDVTLAKNGNTDYVVVIAENEQDEEVLFAVDELRQNFFKATGAMLEEKTDAEVSYSTASTILSIGETSLLQDAGVTYDKNELGPSGYVVQTKGNSVFMVGTTGNGSLYAVFQAFVYSFKGHFL